MTESRRYDAFVSVVVPVTNAETTVGPFVEHLRTVLQTWFRHYEVVLVDNGSVDDTVGQIRTMQLKVPNLQMYILNRRTDFEVALAAGLDNSIGDFVFTVDYHTDPVELLPEMFAFTLTGSEVVCGIVRDRLTRKFYHWANRRFNNVLKAMTGIQLPAGMSDLRLYSRGVVSFINRDVDRHLLLKVLPFQATTKIATFAYAARQDHVRSGGRSLATAFLASITILLASSVVPLRLLTLMTLTVSTLSLTYAVYVIAVALFKNNLVQGWLSLALPMAVMFFFVSTILGVLAEYVFRMAQHTRNSPVYLITGESTSSASDLQRRLNVVQSDGEFLERKRSGLDLE